MADTELWSSGVFPARYIERLAQHGGILAPAFEHDQVQPASLDLQHLLAVWRGEARNSYGELALVSSMALALRGLGQTREDAFTQAQHWWDQRLS